MSKYWLLIGSATPLISTLQFTENPPSLSFVSQFTLGTSPMWLTNFPKLPTTIYAADRTTGVINSLALDINTGGLTHIASVSNHTTGPNNLGIINNGTALGAADYVAGAAFIVNLDPTDPSQFTQDSSLVSFKGSGPLPSQLSPHAHQVGIFSGPSCTELTDGFFALDRAIRRRSARPRPWFR